MIEPTSADGTFWGSVLAAMTATGMAVRWWYHTRKLRNIDITDGDVTKSLTFVLNELHEQIDDLKEEVRLLKLENAALRDGRL